MTRSHPASSPVVSSGALTATRLVAALALMGLTASLAQAQSATPKPDGALRVAEGVLAYPSVKLSVGHDDNVRASQDAAISATVTTLAPTLKLEAQNAAGLYSLTYAGTYARYSGSSEDNSNNHDLTAAGVHTFSARSRLNWSLAYQDRVDARGDAAVPTAEPDQWRGQRLNALYTFGAKQAQGRVETEYTFSNKRYQNNLANTAGSDVDTHQVAGRYFWRVMPRTYLVGEARLATNAYRVNTTKDNTDTRLLVGATWEATAKTTGTAKLGYQRKNFDSTTLTDATGNTYEVSVEWKPLSYSSFTLSANRAVNDALGTGDFEKSNNLGLTWAHKWSTALSSRMSVNGAAVDFVNSTRQDDTLTTSLGLSYGLNRTYTLGLDLAHTKRDSTLATSNYKRNTVLVSVNAAL
ncbi:outer membrane beta-barrel protein [Hydrogenophaga sp.]|uniref:outer membrane beta-barrel protein n=1 Tax=Hydrogenophaga sp. TaxID=1904254 RepID=UPI003F6AC5DE